VSVGTGHTFRGIRVTPSSYVCFMAVIFGHTCSDITGVICIEMFITRLMGLEKKVGSFLCRQCLIQTYELLKVYMTITGQY
jgi:hypothetical protein